MNQSQTIYGQLMESIKKKIASGELKVGDRIASERAMSAQYGISRMTVHNALKKLEDEGILESRMGSGTFVKAIPDIEEKIYLGCNEILSLSMQIQMMGMRSSRKTLSLNKVELEEGSELKGYFPKADQAYEIVRLSLINGDPYALQKVYIPCHIFKEAERFDFEQFSLYDYMADQGGRPEQMISYLRIEPLPEKYLEIMNEEIDKKVFLFDYFGFRANHELVEYTISYHRPKYTSIKYVSQRQ